MKLNYTILFILLILLMGPVLACTPATAQSSLPPTPAAVDNGKPVVPVQVAKVKTGDLASVLTYAGLLQPLRTLDVTANYSDQVVELPAGEGEAVRQGDLLLVFDTTELEIQLSQARLAVSTAEANLAKMRRGTRPEQILATQGALNLARANLARIDNLSESQIEAASNGVVQAQAALKLAQAEYDKIAFSSDVGEKPEAAALEQATAAYETAMANYNAALKGAPIERLALESALLQAQSALALAQDPFVPEDFTIAEVEVKNAQESLKLLQTQLDEARVEAPIEGIVAARHVEAGESPSQGQPLFTLVSAEVEAILAVEEGSLARIRVGQPAAIRVVVYPGRDFPAEVTYIAPVADPQTHTFTVKVAPADPERLLKGGMFANVSLMVAEHNGVLLVPVAAVRQVAGRDSVFVVKDGRAELRPVTLGLAQEDRVEILSGLAAGEQVVIIGQSELEDGTPVRVVTK